LIHFYKRFNNENGDMDVKHLYGSGSCSC